MLCAEMLGDREKQVVSRIANYVRSLPKELRRESLKVHAQHLAIALDRSEDTVRDALILQIAELDRIFTEGPPGEGPGPAAG